MRYTKKEQENAREGILADLKPGDTVFTILRHVSSSGMSRSISLVVFKNGEPRFLDYSAAVILDRPVNRGKHEGIVESGCGMDMGFHLVYSLSRALFHGKVEGDGGYALKQRWL